MRTQLLDVPGGRLAYDDIEGAGPLVVCTPGIGDNRTSYRLLRPPLVEAGYRVVTMDLRGEGESSTDWTDYSPTVMATDILALIRHVDAGPAALVANSYTSGSAVSAAARTPEAVTGLVLIGPFTRDMPRSLFTRLAITVVASRPALWATYWTSLFPSRKPADFAEARKALVANLNEPGRMAALRAMLASSQATNEARMAEVRCPSLVVMGSKDPDFADPAAEAAWVAERLSGQVAMIPGAGHYPHAEFPDVTAEVTLGFLKGLGDSGSRNA